MIKYAHIGYPKSGSTWLQHHVFPVHPKLHHLGRSNGNEIIDDDVRVQLWSNACFATAFMYDAAQGRKVFSAHFDEAIRSGKQACGISQETFTAMIIGGTDMVRRAERLCHAMGSDTRIIIVVRNPLTWIRSLYTGQLREAGMVLTFEEFLSYFYYDQDISPFGSLFYDRVYELYADLFGRDNVHVLPFEWIKEDCRHFADAVCEAMGVGPVEDLDIQPLNESPSPIQLSALLDFNRRTRFFMGGHRYERPWAHTVEPLYRRLGIEPPPRVKEARNKSLFAYCAIDQWVERMRQEGRPPQPMDLAMPETYRQRFENAYASHMYRLQQQTGLDLESLGYPIARQATQHVLKAG